jgi:hypothetical protein
MVKLLLFKTFCQFLKPKKSNTTIKAFLIQNMRVVKEPDPIFNFEKREGT